MSSTHVPRSNDDANFEQDEITTSVCVAASRHGNNNNTLNKNAEEDEDDDDDEGEEDNNNIINNNINNDNSDRENDDDDGVELALTLLDAERPCSRPTRPPPDIDRLISSWRWKLRPQRSRSNFLTGMRSNDCASSSNHLNCATDSSSITHVQPVSSTTCRPFSFSEDCQVADVCTSITPDCQRAEITRRMPGRNWSEVKARFEKLCSDARWRKPPSDPADHANNHDNRRRFFRFRRLQEGITAKPECPIRKAVSKFR